MTPARKLILASGSPSRLAVLRSAGIDPEVVVSGVDEQIDLADTRAAVVALAERKAEAVAARCSNALVIGCDSMLDLDGTGYTKPGSLDAALAGWRRMAGREATLCTGHCVVLTDDGRRASGLATTVVRFGTPTERELAAYMATGEPLVGSGGFTIEGFGAPFVDGIDGDPSNVLGLSMPLLRKLLGDLGVPIVELWRTAVAGGATGGVE